MEVYKAISAVMLAIGKVGISKDRTAQSYKFRGVDDVLNALSPLLSANNLVVLPRVISRESVERKTAKEVAIFYVTLLMEFDFVSAIDGSKHTVATYGEAMDMSDKATNKAMSAAFKYACFQTFCIPTEGDNDTENATHEVVATYEKVSELDVLTIRNALKEIGKDENAALKFWKLTSLNDMPKTWVIDILVQLAQLKSKGTGEENGTV